MEFNNWIKIWLKEYKKPFVKKTTMDTLGYCLKHICGEFGEDKLESIRGIDIQRFINRLSYIPNMQDKCRKYLAEIMEFAYLNRYIDFNPMPAVKFKPYKTSNTLPMNVNERNFFIKSLKGKKYELLYLAYLYTGARLSELITPGSFIVDFDNKLVHINGTKTDSSKRTLPLFLKLEDALLCVPNYKKYFTSYKRDYVYLLFTRHCKRIGLEGFCIRSLRCTFSLLCYELGVRETTIQAWLGHTTTKTTKKYYLNKNTISNCPSDRILKEIKTVNKNL